MTKFEIISKEVRNRGKGEKSQRSLRTQHYFSDILKSKAVLYIAANCISNYIEFIYFSFFPFIFISWRLITLQYCSGFCNTLTWISCGFTCVPHPEPPSHFPPHPIPLGHLSAPAPNTCLMHPTWTGNLFHNWWYTCFEAVLSDYPTLTFSHRVQKSVLYICVSFSVLYIGLSLPSF